MILSQEATAGRGHAPICPEFSVPSIYDVAQSCSLWGRVVGGALQDLGWGWGGGGGGGVIIYM